MPQSRRTYSPTDDTSAIGSDEATPHANSQQTQLLIADAPGDGWTAPRAVAYTAPQALPAPAQDLDDPDLPYWLALNRVKGIGPARFKLLLDAFGTAEAAWRGTISAWQAAGLDTRTANGLEQQRKRIVPEAEVERLIKLRVGVLRLSDATYPRLLREITLPPPVLYVRGTLTPEDDWAVAIVGTRRATAYGRQIAERLATELAQHGITIVSGLARGIDTHAHTSALDAGSRTIAVLGCGPDLVYPPENAKLAARIIESGCIITEFGPGTQPEAGNFPARNRLISGLSLGVLVAEAPDDSGALITTRFAAEQGRDVFAVPGNITSRASAGANRLIQDGAKLVLDVNDILSELNTHLVSPSVSTRSIPSTRRLPATSPETPTPPPAQMELSMLLPENDAESLVLQHLPAGGEPRHIDEICRASSLPIATVSGSLVMLELKGHVVLVGPMTYARPSE
ncbi:MAG: DNA-processing protein DprA [Ktedonobacterales bacterium]